MSQSHGRRGNALPETSLLVSVSMLLLFGAVQEAIFGFDQVTADGATFMASQKSVAMKGSGAGLADAQKVISLIFPRVPQSTVSIATSSSGQPLFETSVLESVHPLGVPGVWMPNDVTIQSREVEPGVASGNAGVPSLCFADVGANATPTYNLGMGTVLNPSSGTVNSQQLSGHTANIQSVQSVVTNLPTDLTAVVTALVNVLNLPIIGPVIATALGTTVGNAGTYIAGLVQPVLNGSLAGTATTSQLTGLLGGVLSIVSGVLGSTSPALQALSSSVNNLQSDLTKLNGAESGLAAITGLSGC